MHAAPGQLPAPAIAGPRKPTLCGPRLPHAAQLQQRRGLHPPGQRKPGHLGWGGGSAGRDHRWDPGQAAAAVCRPGRPPAPGRCVLVGGLLLPRCWQPFSCSRAATPCRTLVLHSSSPPMPLPALGPPPATHPALKSAPRPLQTSCSWTRAVAIWWCATACRRLHPALMAGRSPPAQGPPGLLPTSMATRRLCSACGSPLNSSTRASCSSWWRSVCVLC